MSVVILQDTQWPTFKPIYRKDFTLLTNSGEEGKLTFEFKDKKISKHRWDYTILVEFTHDESAETCAVTFVAFP